jgi:hypothetical protein
MKKSQISLFVIIGLIFLILVGIFFIFLKTSVKKETTSEKVAIESFSDTSEKIETYVEDCLETVSTDAIDKYGIGNKTRDSLSNYINRHMLDCINDFEDFKKYDIDINYLPPNATVGINNRLVLVDLEFPVNIQNEQQKKEYETFEYKVILPDDFKDPLEGFEMIFRGVFYKKEVLSDPRPLVVFIAKIDLDDQDIGFYVTPKIAPNTLVTSQFLADNGLQLAVNGGGFDIGGTNEVNGYSAYDGVAYSSEDIKPGETVFITENNEVTLGSKEPNDMKYAITGLNHIIENGKISDRFLYTNHPNHKPGYDILHPRTSIGKDENKNWLIIIVIDGRNPGISEGVDSKELGQLHLKYGSTNMINMDGGGSTTLVVENNGFVKVLNTPSDGHERPVANHFGVYAKKITVDNVDSQLPETPIPDLDENSPNSNIGLFRVVSQGIAAGAQPSEAGYAWLKSQGYKTVIDVQGNDNSAAVNAAGLNYLHLVYDGTPPSAAWVNNVVSAMNNPDNQPVYVHCQYGQHRTGVAVAIYREQVEHVCYNEAYNELMRWAEDYFPGTDEEKTAVFNMIRSYASC